MPTIIVRHSGLAAQACALWLDEPAAAWSARPLLTGHVRLQAEGSRIEVRAFRYRPS